METAVIVYCLACYLYTLGLIFGGLKDRGYNSSMVFGMIIHFILAPIMTPVVMGYIRYSEQDYL